MNRRELLTMLGMLPFCGCADRPSGIDVNDVHSRLNPTRVARLIEPASLADVQAAVRESASSRQGISIAGGRHAMGGQQFGANTALIDMRGMHRVLGFDAERGLIEVEAGIEWPELVTYTHATQRNASRQWGIVQKQTGADKLTIGGALAANAHGRGLTFAPIVQDVESLELVDADGELVRCDRRQNRELFRLAIGGYGLFGVITSVTLRLALRRKLERRVEMIDVEELSAAFSERIDQGCLYGDFQFSIEPSSTDFMHRGILSAYRPVPDDTPMPGDQRVLRPEDWSQLIMLAHTDKARAFELYTNHYLATDRQIYWSDDHQMSTYLDHYHLDIDRREGARFPASEMITELYVPRAALAAFLDAARTDFRQHGVEVIYGSIRLIERDDETFLRWAREPWACIVLNIHVVHSAKGQRHAKDALQRLVDTAIGFGGNYYLTYHRHASRSQIEACYPQFREFLSQKLIYDPEERFQSDWYRHYRDLFAHT